MGIRDLLMSAGELPASAVGTLADLLEQRRRAAEEQQDRALLDDLVDRWAITAEDIQADLDYPHGESPQ